MSPVRWPFRRSPKAREAPAAYRADRVDRADRVLLSGVCWACGRSDLPLDTAWDPPICIECDAQINEDEILEELERDR